MIDPNLVSNALDVVTVGVLVAIFHRLGALSGHLEGVKSRVTHLEGRVDAQTKILGGKINEDP